MPRFNQDVNIEGVDLDVRGYWQPPDVVGDGEGMLEVYEVYVYESKQDITDILDSSVLDLIAEKAYDQLRGKNE